MRRGPEQRLKGRGPGQRVRGTNSLRRAEQGLQVFTVSGDQATLGHRFVGDPPGCPVKRSGVHVGT